MLLLISIEIMILTSFNLFLIFRFDENNGLVIRRREIFMIVGISLAAGSWITVILEHWGIPGMLCLGVLASYLLTSTITDLQTTEVYDFLHLFGLAAGTAAVVWSGPDVRILLNLPVYWAVQHFLFMKMYGHSDGFAFLVCAIYESCFGDGMLTYLLHMLSAFILLGIVQGMRRNINRHGNLKTPVPFVPYIAVTVIFFLS